MLDSGCTPPRDTDLLKRMKVKSDTPIAVMQNKMLNFVVKHRDELGYTEESRTAPYFFMTNDVSNKLAQFFELVQKVESIDMSKKIKIMLAIMDLYMKTYEDPGVDSNACCSLYHSVPKEQFQKLCGQDSSS